MTNPILQLEALGQSLWYDNIRRGLLRSGALEAMIQSGEIRGVTSNPSIFNQAIARSSDYDDALAQLAKSSLTAEEFFWCLAVEDIQAVADLFQPLYERSNRGDGYISLEVNPGLANDAAQTLAEAKGLWKRVNRPNLMVKIPATKEGIPAIEQAVAAGLNINVTLIFSLARYAEVMEAYLCGLETRVSAGLPVDGIASVASFFVSRVDTKVDAALKSLIDSGGAAADPARRLLGKAAIANAKLAYQLFRDTFGADRFQRLARQGARLQRPLWASTSTKNPAYRDVIYVEELIGADTVNTAPPQTIDAFRDHGIAEATLTRDVGQAKEDLDQLVPLGISMQQVTDELEAEGVESFKEAFRELVQTIEGRRR